MNCETKKKKKYRLKLRPGAFICLAFLLVILVGSFFLAMPFSLNEGVEISYIDSLFTSVSAVCVTGLATVDIANTFNIFGRIVVMILIQLGGLGVTTFSVIIMLLYSGSLSVSQSKLIKEAWNLETIKEVKMIFIKVILYNLICETIGVLLSLISFSQKMDFGSALGVSIFHSVASFNNAGFDIFGTGKSLITYQNDILLNLTTDFLIIFGGIGFLVILDLIKKRFNLKKLTLNSKIILTITAVLLVSGTLLIKLSEWDNISWLGAFNFSVSCRTAGFASFDVYSMRDSTHVLMIILQFIGASPGSTGGGIKVTTFFVMLLSVRSTITSTPPHAYKRRINDSTQKRAFLIMFVSLTIVVVSSLIISAIEKKPIIVVDNQERVYGYKDFIFETVSAFATVGLSTGFTPYFTIGSKIVLIICMYFGRLGPLTIISLWSKRSELSTARFCEENISIG